MVLKMGKAHQRERLGQKRHINGALEANIKTSTYIDVLVNKEIKFS